MTNDTLRATKNGTTARVGRPLADFTADPRMLVLAAMALAVGTFGAVSAFVLIKLIGLVTNLVWFGRISTAATSFVDVRPSPWMVVAPVLGGLAIGVMARYGSRKIRGHGIPEAIETILIGQSRIEPRVAILKPLSSAISIGSGGPFGAEGPIIMTGGALGSLFAQFFDVSAAERKTLLVAGAAAGMTGIFGTPIAAVLLSIELLLFEWKPRSFIPVSVAAAVAIAWRPLFFGPAPLFPFDGLPPAHWLAFPLALALGILVGLVSGALTSALYKLEDLFETLPIHWMWWPALGGLFVGLGGLLDPRALGVGYGVIGDILANRMTVAAVAMILGVKAAIWLVSLASGTSGGVVAPLLIVGGALGWLVGLVLPGDPAFWALLAMAAMLGGTMRAPLTGAVFGTELTGNLHALPALLVATVAAYAVTVLLLKRSILTEKIARRGRHITHEYAVDPFEASRAADIMTTQVVTLAASMPLADGLSHLLAPEASHGAYPVVDADGRMVGVASRADALRWSASPIPPDERLSERVAARDTVVAFPMDVVGDVVDLMIAGDMDQIVVVDPRTRHLLGIVTRKDLLMMRRAIGLSERDRQRFFRLRRRRVVATQPV